MICLKLEASQTVSSAVLKTAYFTIFDSHILYTVFAWRHSLGVNTLLAVQRKAVRLKAIIGYRSLYRSVFSIIESLLFAKKCKALESRRDQHHSRNKKSSGLLLVSEKVSRWVREFENEIF